MEDLCNRSFALPMTIAAPVQNHNTTLRVEVDIQVGIEVQVTLPDQPARETPPSFLGERPTGVHRREAVGERAPG